jgi:hypothetical protein
VKLAAYGLEIDLPRGWEGRIYRRSGAEPTLHAASFGLPIRDADFGSSATERMPQGGVFLALKEYRPDARLIPGSGLFAASTLPLPLDPRRFHHRALQVARRGQVGLQHFFTSAGRPFCLYAVVHQPHPGSTLAAAARDQVGHLSRVLSSLTIHEPR